MTDVPAAAPPAEPAPAPAVDPDAIDLAQLARICPAGFAYYASNRQWIPAEHLLLLSEALAKVATGECKRLIVSMPPRHGKSELTSRYFPAWYLGLYPDRKVMFASYSDDFAQDWGAAARDELKEHGPALFGVRPTSPARASRWRVEDLIGKPTGGGMQCAGMKGGFTGRGADLLLIDDPIKNDDEAQSATMRRKHWRWFQTTAMPRLDSIKGAVVLVMTRWHHDDLAGRLIKQDRDGNGEGWTVINLPALAERDDPMGRKPGEALWEEQWPREELVKIRVRRGSHVWYSLYQGRPTPLEGGLFKEHWLTLAQWIGPPGHAVAYMRGARAERVLVDDMILFATVDLALTLKEESDFSVCGVFGLAPNGLVFILEIKRKQLEGPEIVPWLERAHEEWDLDGIWIEATQFQAAIVQFAREASLPVKPVYPKKEKVARAIPATAEFEGKRMFILDSSWTEELIDELTTFPHSAHKDQTDVVSMGTKVAAQLKRIAHKSKITVGGAGGGQRDQPRVNGKGERITSHQRRRARAAKGKGTWSR